MTPVPFPVEYKRGKPKAHDADLVQLCAQALCLEEMLGIPVPAGALFYGKTRRRQDTVFDASLRGRVSRGRQFVHNLCTGVRMPRDYIPSTTDAGKLAFGQNAVNRRRNYQGQMTFVASEWRGRVAA